MVKALSRDQYSGALAYSESSAWLEHAVQERSRGALCVYSVDSLLHAWGVLHRARTAEVLKALVNEMRKGSVDDEVCQLESWQFGVFYENAEAALRASERLRAYARDAHRKLSEEIRAGAHAAGIIEPGPNVLTLSAGISARPEMGCSGRQWLERAQGALSRAIRGGMDRVEVAD